MGEIASSGHGPFISVAWLVLSHGAFLGASIAATSISAALIITTYAEAFKGAHKFQHLAIGWTIASLLISLWTCLAIAQTWAASHLFPKSQRIFNDFGFALLTFITLVVAYFNLWTLFLCLKWRKPHRKPITQN